jgi:hypothetical protein
VQLIAQALHFCERPAERVVIVAACEHGGEHARQQAHAPKHLRRAAVEIQGIDDAALSVQDGGVDVGRGQIDEPHRQLANELLEIEPLPVRGADGLIRPRAPGDVGDRGDREGPAAGPHRMEADADRRFEAVPPEAAGHFGVDSFRLHAYGHGPNPHNAGR